MFGWLGLSATQRALAQSTVLSIEPITWNVVGLDSNSPATGPQDFPVGAEVCNISGATVNAITVTFAWTTANAYIDLRGTTPDTINIPTLAAGACYDAYFEIEVVRDAAAYNTARRYVITATAGAESASTPVPREIFVEHLISQNRNATRDLRYGPVGADCGTLQSVAAGGALNLVVGQSYRLCLFATTATQGYEQLETFLTLPNTIFQVISVETDYSANTSGNVSTTDHPQLYADACYWETDPNSPNYRACNVSSLKAGGTIVTAYDVTILSGGGTSYSLHSLIYDFSGSSFHYNSDYDSAARTANFIDPTSSTIAKQFSPATITSGGVSTLIITLGNPNAGALSGYNFTDTLPGDMVVATPATYSTNGCGTPTFAPTAGSNTLTFANGTVAGNGTCTISVKVTASTIQLNTNTTNNLFIGTVDTGKTATADLDVTNAPLPPTCTGGVSLASWAFPTAGGATAPAPSTSSVTASATYGSGLTPSLQGDRTGTAGSSSWASDNVDNTGGLTLGLNEYFQFTLNTTGFTEVTMQFYTQRTSQGPQNVRLYYGMTGTENTTATADPITAGWQPISHTLTTGINSAGNTVFRLYLYNASLNNSGHYAQFDDVTFTGCGIPTAPSLTKAFSPNPIGDGGISTLTFTLSNPNPSTALTAASFTDTLPAGMTVAAVPGGITTCVGATWLPLPFATTLTFSGGTIPAGSPGTCTVQVNVTSATYGPSTNVSGFLSTTQTGINNKTNGSASATLIVLEPPAISKQFSPNPIPAGGTSTLTVSIINPNPSNAIAGVAFTDVLPLGVLIAPTPNAASTCGGVLVAVANTNTVDLAGGAIAAGGSCTVQVDVTALLTGNYVNTTTTVSHTVNALVFFGGTATDTLVTEAGTPGITLLKQVGTTNTLAGPWFNYVSVAPGTPIYYLLTVENTGDVPLTAVNVADATLSGAGVSLAGCTTALLPVADANDDDHIFQCIVGPLTAAAGTQANVATATGTPPTGPNVTDDSNTATYATAALTMVKAATPTTFTTAGTLINYTFTVTNTGSSTLDGPVTIDDDVTTNEACPALTTIGDNDNFFDPGEIITCTASYTTTATDLTNGEVTNVASAIADGFTSPTDTETVTTPFADLELDKALTTSPTTIGDAIQYTLTLTNNGPLTATNVAVVDTVPASVTVGTVTPGTTSVNGSATTWTAPTWTIPTIASGETVTLVIDGTVNAAGTITNGAEVTASDQADPDSTVNNNVPTEDDQDSVDATVVIQSDLELDKAMTSTIAPVTIGDAIQYTLTLTNNGPTTATNVAAVDTIPASVTVGTVTPGTTSVNASATTWTAPTWTIPTIASGETVTLVIDGTVNAAGTITNGAEVTASDQPDPDSTVNNNVPTEDDQDSVDTVIIIQSDLELDKAMTSTTAPTTVGDAIQYTLTLTNNGPTTATNVAVGDTIPASITVGTVTPGTTSVNASATTWTAPTWTIPTIASGETVTLVIDGTVNASGAISNSAEVTASDQPDPDSTVNNNEPTEDDQDNADVIIGDASDLELGKVLTTTPTNVGDPIQYTLTLTNNGPSTATNVAVVDNVPASVTVGTVTPGTTSINASATTWTAPTWTIPTIASGETVTLVIDGTVNSTGLITNGAEVTASDQPDPDSTVNNNDPTEDDQANADVTIGENPVIGIAKTVSAPVDNANGTYTVIYTLNVENLGNIALQNVQVTDDLTTEFGTYEPTLGAVDAAGEYTVLNLNVGALTAAVTPYTGAADQTLLGGTDTLPVGAAIYPLVFEVTFYPNFADAPFLNQATATGETGTPDGTPETTDTSNFGTDPDPDSDGDPSEAGENDPTPIDFGFIADLSVSKANDVGGGTTTGGTFTWTLTVANSGTGDAVFPDGATILQDELPATGLTYGAVGVINDVGITNLANIDCVIAGTTLTCTANGAAVTIGSATGSVDITIAVTVDVAGLYTNPTGTCAVDTANVVTENDETNNACNSDTVSADLPNVAASKTDALTGDVDNNGLVDPGDTIGYTVVISNSGIVDATAVVFTDAPDANTTLLVGSVTTTQGTVTTGNTAGDTSVAVDVGTLTAGGGTVTITYSVTLNVNVPSTVTSIANSGLVTGANIPDTPSNDPDTTDDGDPTTTEINPPPGPTPEPTSEPQPGEPAAQPAPAITVFDPALSKVGILQAGGIGLQNEQIEWIFTVSNAGNAAGQNVQVTDSIRPELRIDRLNVDPPLTGSVNGQVITVTIPTLAPGQTVTFSVVTTVIRGGGEMDNTACLTADNFGNTLCSTSSVVTELPATGQSPWWRDWLIGLLLSVGLGLAGLLSVRRITLPRRR
ncbi:MAG: DUF11 domain-containing protein [Anaerolineae bacterium]|nr:DUF11 domain-containing protein [Anaerolineae bacterium]